MYLTSDMTAFALAVLVVPILVSTLIAVAHYFSPKNYGKYTYDNYECGEVVKGDFQAPLPLQYYFFMIAFVIFDVDILLLLPWASNIRGLGFGVFLDVLGFLAIMLVGLFYVSKKGYMRWLNE